MPVSGQQAPVADPGQLSSGQLLVSCQLSGCSSSGAMDFAGLADLCRARGGGGEQGSCVVDGAPAPPARAVGGQGMAGLHLGRPPRTLKRVCDTLVRPGLRLSRNRARARVQAEERPVSPPSPPALKMRSGSTTLNSILNDMILPGIEVKKKQKKEKKKKKSSLKKAFNKFRTTQQVVDDKSGRPSSPALSYDSGSGDDLGPVKNTVKTFRQSVTESVTVHWPLQCQVQTS